MSLTTITRRPPRPGVPDAHLLGIAREHGIASSRIKTITVLPDTDVLVQEDAGNRYRICTVPDGAGRTGLLVDFQPNGYRIGNLRNFTPRTDHTVSNEEWELADFDWLADKITVPSLGVMQVDGFAGYRTWLLTGENSSTTNPTPQPWHPPVAAYALWRERAGRAAGAMAAAADKSDLCAALRQEVIRCGWLSAKALKELDAR